MRQSQQQAAKRLVMKLYSLAHAPVEASLMGCNAALINTFPLVHKQFTLSVIFHRRLAQHWVNNIWAKVSTSLFYRTEVSA